MNNHTPGPWFIDCDESPLDFMMETKIIAEGKIICYFIESTKYDFANAILISSATDLLEALRGLLPFADRFEDDGPYGEGWQSSALRKAISDSEQAIAKATGQ